MSTIGSKTFTCIIQISNTEVVKYSNFSVLRWRICAPPQTINGWLSSSAAGANNSTNFFWQPIATASDDNKYGDGGTFTLGTVGTPTVNDARLQFTATVSYPAWYKWSLTWTGGNSGQFLFPGHLFDVLFLVEADYTNSGSTVKRQFLMRGGASRVDLYPQSGLSPVPGISGAGENYRYYPNDGGLFQYAATVNYEADGSMRVAPTRAYTITMRGGFVQVVVTAAGAGELLNYWRLLPSRTSGDGAAFNTSTSYLNLIRYAVGDYQLRDSGYLSLADSAMNGISFYLFDDRGNVYFQGWTYNRPPLRVCVFDNDAGEITSLTTSGSYAQDLGFPAPVLEKRRFHLQQPPTSYTALSSSNLDYLTFPTSGDVRGGFVAIAWRSMSTTAAFNGPFSGAEIADAYNPAAVSVLQGETFQNMDSANISRDAASLDVKHFLDDGGYGVMWLTTRINPATSAVVPYKLLFARRFGWGQLSHTAFSGSTLTPPTTLVPFDAAVQVTTFTTISYPEWFLFNSAPWEGTTLYVSNLANGLWSSDDLGATWTQSSDFTRPWVDSTPSGAKYLGWTCAQIDGGRWITTALEVSGLTPTVPLTSATLSPPAFVPTAPKVVLRTSDDGMKTWSEITQIGTYPLDGLLLPPAIGEMRQSGTTILYVTNGRDVSWLSKDGLYWQATPTDLGETP